MTSSPEDAAPEPQDGAPLSRRALREATRSRSGIAQAAGEDFSIAEAVGGPRGIVEALLPGLLFVSWFTVTRDLQGSLVASLVAAGLLVTARIAMRSNVTQAVSGLIGVGICAWAASRTGEAVDFYAPGFLLNTGYAVVYALSTLRFPRVGRVPAWGPLPVIGLLIGPLVGEGLAWRHDPRRLRAYRQVTWLWVAMFVLRLLVQLPLYFAGAVGALGVARLAMGVPLFAFTAWLSWLVLRRVPVARPAQPQHEPAPTSD